MGEMYDVSRNSWPIDPRVSDFCLPALLSFAFACFTPALLGDGDTWWHVKAGEWMIDHRAVPMVDPFSFTFADQPWHAHAWLAELLMAAVFRLSGWGGVVVLCAAAFGLAVGLLHQWLRRFVSPVTAAVATFLAASCLTPSLLARPHLLVLPLMVIWMRVLLQAREQDRAPSPAWLLLIVLWVNSHGTALFAVGLVGFFALEALVEALPDWRRVVRQWGLFGIGAALALLCTPRGIEGLIFLVELTQMQSLARIIEWMPTNFSKLNGVELLIGAGIFVLLTRGIKVPPLRIGLLLMILHMTLVHQRHQMLLGIIGTMLVCEAIGRAEGNVERQAASSRLWPALTGLGAIILIGLRLSLGVSFPQGEMHPDRAFAAVPVEYHSQPVLNMYASGGYLIGKGVRPFIDGRTDLYGDAFNARYIAIMDGVPGELEKALAEYDIAWSLLPADSAPAKALDHKPGWKRVYADNVAMVHLRVP